MFLEVFEFFSPLGLLLLKVDGTIGLSDQPTYVEMMEHQLSKSKTIQMVNKRKVGQITNMAREDIDFPSRVIFMQTGI